jgi:electron transfer flavoprotein-quinone oxidoreductase
MGDLDQQKMPRVVNGIVQDLFTVTNPEPKPRLRTIVRKQMKRNGVKWRDAVKDGLRAARTFG